MRQTNSLLYIRKPSQTAVGQFIASQRDLPFSYPEVGATKTVAPAGYTVDHNRIKLGEGEATYNSVWYDIYAFSRPQHPLVALAYPYARRLQKRFARDSLAVMRQI